MSGGKKLGGESRVYVHDADGEVHSFDPGDDVPAWAVKKITNPDVWGNPDDTADGDAGDGNGDEGETETVVPYAKRKKADLEAEVAKRNEGRDEDDLIEVEGKGTVADLVAALDADDAAQAAADDSN